LVCPASPTLPERLEGNTATITAHVKLDRTPPTIVAHVSPTPNAAGWNHSDVTVTFTCADQLSGLTSCPASSTVHNDGGTTVTGTAIDNAGNSATTAVNINLDETAPTLGLPAWSANPQPANGSTTLTVPGAHSLSGVAGGEYYVDSDPGVGNGIPMSYSGGNLTATIGTGLASGVYPVGIRGRDVAGNWTTMPTILVVVDPAIPVGFTGKNKKDLVPVFNSDVLPGKIYAPGADPATASPIYHVSGSFAKGNSVRVR
jgi:hypothetical protein